jgi:Phytanoyl-CoA dioxygenase (PhyH)
LNSLDSLEQYFVAHPGPAVDAPVRVAGYDVVEVPARAGDLVVWSSRLPHHGGRNHGQRPRLSMALAMRPEGSEAQRSERVECWQQRRAPRWWRGWRGQIDPEPDLPLGSRRSGVDSWAWIGGHDWLAGRFIRVARCLRRDSGELALVRPCPTPGLPACARPRLALDRWVHGGVSDYWSVKYAAPSFPTWKREPSQTVLL